MMQRPERGRQWRHMIAKEGVLLSIVLLLFACGPRQPSPREASSVSSPSPPQATPGVSTDVPIVLFLGTSLTAGYGLDPPAQAFPALLQTRMDGEGLKYRVVNGGVSGETSAGALRRVDWLLRQRVAVLVIETGANDSLRGQDPTATRDNIQAILDRARRPSPAPRLVLLGMVAPPNLGSEYGRRFHAIYPELARKNGVVLVPFLLEGVAGIPALNQADGSHPTAEGHRRMAETVWRALRPLL